MSDPFLPISFLDVAAEVVDAMMHWLASKQRLVLNTSRTLKNLKICLCVYVSV